MVVEVEDERGREVVGADWRGVVDGGRDEGLEAEEVVGGWENTPDVE